MGTQHQRDKWFAVVGEPVGPGDVCTHETRGPLAKQDQRTYLWRHRIIGSEQQQVRRTREPLGIPDQRRSRHTGPQEHWTQDQSNNRNNRRDKQLIHRIRGTVDTQDQKNIGHRIRATTGTNDETNRWHTGSEEQLTHRIRRTLDTGSEQQQVRRTREPWGYRIREKAGYRTKRTLDSESEQRQVQRNRQKVDT